MTIFAPRHSAVERAAFVNLIAAGFEHGVDTEEFVRRIVDGATLQDACATAGLQATTVHLSIAELFARAADLRPALLCSEGGVVAVVNEVVGPPWKRRLQLAMPEQTSTIDAAGLARFAGADGRVEILLIEAPGLAGAAAADHVSPQQRLWSLLALERRDVGVVVAFGILASMLALATPLAVQVLVSSIATSALLQPLLVVSVLLGAALTAGGILRVLQLVVVEVLQRRVFVRLVGDLAWRLPRVAVAEREKQDTTKLVNRFFDVVTVQKVLAALLLDGVMLVLELIIGLALLAAYSPLLLAVSLALLVGVVVVVFVFGIGGVSSSVDESYAKHDVAEWLEELVRHPTLFRGASARRFGMQRLDASTRRYILARQRQFSVLLRQAIGGFSLQVVAAVGLLAVGGWLVVQGRLTLGQLTAAELIVTAITWGLIKLHKQIEAAYDLLAAVDKIGHLIDLDTEGDHGIAVAPGPLAVAVEGVLFDEDDGLGAVSLQVAAGEVVAVLEHDSHRGIRLTNTMFGLQKPPRGRVQIGGDDVRMLSLPSLRERVQLVRQPEVFEGTVAENLRAGHAHVDSRALMAALAVVELDRFFVEGLEQRLVPGSQLLTPTVGRCLMIARALVADAGLILLDGALDGLAPAVVVRILDRLARTGATVLIVTADDDLARLVPRTITLAEASLPSPPPPSPHTAPGRSPNQQKSRRKR